MTAQVGDTLYSPAAQKAILRRQLRATRMRLTPAQCRGAARRITLRLLRLLPSLRPGGVLALYLSAGSEVPTDALCRSLLRRGWRLAVPHIQSAGRMHFVRMNPHSRTRPAPHRTRQLAGRQVRLPRRALGLMLLPVLGFDAQGRRLGAGGGYYDRYLAARPGRRRPRLIGLAYACQQTVALPQEAWDQPLDLLCSERRLHRIPSTRRLSDLGNGREGLPL